MGLPRAAARVLGVGLMLLASPAVAAAQGEFNAVVFEVTETMKLRGPAPTVGEGRRMATAALMGMIPVGTPLCPTELTATFQGLTHCGVSVVASNNIDLSTGMGPVSGKFAVVVPGDNPDDGPELVVFRGTLRARIDLSLAVSETAPLGALQQGTWTGTGVVGPFAGTTLKGDLFGTFRLPRFIPALGKVVYLVPSPDDAAGCTPVPVDLVGCVPMEVQAHERSLGVPTVRLELTLRVNGR